MHMQAGERVTCESSGNQPHKKEDLVYAHALSIMGGVCTVHVCKHIYIVSGERERQREGVAILVQAASGLRTVGPLSSFLSLLQGPRRSKSLPVCHFLPSLLKQLLSGRRRSVSSSTCVLLPGRSVCNVAPSRLSAALQDFYLGGAIRLFHNVTCTGGSREGDLYPRYRGASPLFEMTSSASSTSSSPPQSQGKEGRQEEMQDIGENP